MSLNLELFLKVFPRVPPKSALTFSGTEAQHVFTAHNLFQRLDR